MKKIGKNLFRKDFLDMKNIEINGEEYLFRTDSIDFEFHSEFRTYFYSKTEYDIERKLKYKWPLRIYWEEIRVPKYLFKVNFDITSPSYTRKYVNTHVLQSYETWKGLLARKDEIEKGIYL